MTDSPFTIAPKDKRVLRSSKVREWYRLINTVLEPEKQKILDAANRASTDAMIYGFGAISITEGDVKYPNLWKTTEYQPSNKSEE